MPAVFREIAAIGRFVGNYGQNSIKRSCIFLENEIAFREIPTNGGFVRK